MTIVILKVCILFLNSSSVNSFSDFFDSKDNSDAVISDTMIGNIKEPIISERPLNDKIFFDITKITIRIAIKILFVIKALECPNLPGILAKIQVNMINPIITLAYAALCCNVGSFGDENAPMITTDDKIKVTANKMLDIIDAIFLDFVSPVKALITAIVIPNIIKPAPPEINFVDFIIFYFIQDIIQLK